MCYFQDCNLSAQIALTKTDQYIEDEAKKMERYRNLVQLLPAINGKTLKKLMSHLVAIASHSGKVLKKGGFLSVLSICEFI